jgi:hypothetical protein
MEIGPHKSFTPILLFVCNFVLSLLLILSTKQGSLFVCFVLVVGIIEISQTMSLPTMLLVPLESPSQVDLHVQLSYMDRGQVVAAFFFARQRDKKGRKECGGQGRSSNRGRFLFLFYFLDDFFFGPKNKSQE